MSASTRLALAIYCHYTSAGYRWVLALWFVETDVWFSHTLDSKNLWGFSDDLSFCSSPSPSACLLSSGLSGLFVPESCDAGWQSSALWFVQPWWKPDGLKETAGSFPLRDLGLCGGHKMLVCHKGSRVVEQHCQYSDLIIKREKN